MLTCTFSGSNQRCFFLLTESLDIIEYIDKDILLQTASVNMLNGPSLFIYEKRTLYLHCDYDDDDLVL